MRMHWLRGCLLLAAVVGMTGCGGSQVDDSAGPPEDDAHLGTTVEASLSGWLKQSRSDLANLVEERADTVSKQRDHVRDNPDSAFLLPNLHPPSTLPVYREAKYSETAGFSLPPYARSGDKDAGLALHLARLGDREAALKVAPADPEVRSAIDSCKTERNYPVEWTQYVALTFQSEELKLSEGDPQAAAELIQMHAQLRTVLDAKAAAGPLGSALLPLGRRALADAGAAWRKPKFKKLGFAGDVDAALKDWGASPSPSPALTPGARSAEIARVFPGPATGQTFASDKPAVVQRVLDLLELPVPTDGAQAVVAFLGADKRLTELLVLYRPNTLQTFPEPVNLAHLLVDHAATSDDPVRDIGLLRQTYTAGGLKYEAAVFSRGEGLGGFVRVGDARAVAKTTPLPAAARDFGAVHFDRGFEQSRVRLGPEKSGAVLELDAGAGLARLKQPVADPAPASAVVRRVADRDLTESVQLRWSSDALSVPVEKLALPLWAAYGSSHILGVEDADGDYLALAWEDGRTRLALHVPYEPQPPVFTAENLFGDEIAACAKAAEAYDQSERKAHLDAGRPLDRLPRFLKLSDVTLGLTRKEVQAVLPRQASVEHYAYGSDLSLVFRDPPPPEATYWARQMFLRFGPDDRLAEVRVRYVEGPAKSDDHHPSLLGTLKKGNGAAEDMPAPWAGLWTDLPAREPRPARYRWIDDQTVMTCQRDGGGAEVVIHDWPAGRPLDKVDDLPPLRFCPDGLGGVALGDGRAKVEQKYPDNRPLPSGDGLALPPPDGNYETVAVWFENDKVVRIVAQHTARPGKDGDASKKLQEAWARDFARLGAQRRQDGPNGPVTQSYGFHDDRVRVRLLAQQTSEGVRLFTEWRNWPVAAKP